MWLVSLFLFTSPTRQRGGDAYSTYTNPAKLLSPFWKLSLQINTGTFSDAKWPAK